MINNKFLGRTTRNEPLHYPVRVFVGIRTSPQAT